jgi:hypothetical protein
MDLDLLQSRLDYFHSLGYLTYHSDTKQHPLLPATLLLVLKVYSMAHGLSFPRVNAKSIRGVDTPVLYTTQIGDQIFLKYISTMSPELFEMIAPVFKGTLNPTTFVLSNPKTLQNLYGLVGKTTRKTPKVPLKIHLLVDNSPPFEYLNAEYVYESMYEARMFINKLVQYVPPSRLELWRVRTDSRTGHTRRDPEPVLITKKPYKL